MPHTHLAYLPMGGKKMNLGTRKYMSGRGMGSVLLNQGGTGSASAYESVADYTATTGRDPYNPVYQGRGLGSLSKKLADLSVSSKKKKVKNINFNL